jgi:hypothetical protein
MPFGFEMEAKPAAAAPAISQEVVDRLEARIQRLEADLKDKELDLAAARERESKLLRRLKQKTAPGKEERRDASRYAVQLKVGVVNRNADADQQKTYYGRTRDISMRGGSILCDENIVFSKDIHLLLSLPSRQPGGRVRVVEIRSRTHYTVLDAEADKFRIGFQFVEFIRDAKTRLKEFLDDSTSAIPGS